MRIRLLVLTAVFTMVLSAFPLNAARQTAPAGAAPDEEALGGLDPVRLVQGQEVDGKDALSVTWRGLVYYFATPETKAAFEKEPDRYAVQLDGLCARMGAPVVGAQSLHAVHDGRIYVFGSEDCQKLFVANASRYLDTAPSPLAGVSAGGAAKGRALLDRAVAAHGGAALSAVRGFREKTRQQFDGMRGPVTIAVETTALLPDRWRQESSNQYGQFLFVVTPETAFRGSSRGAPRPMPDALRAYYRAQLGGHPLALLHAHRASPLRAGALDPVTEGGAALDRVAVEHDGETAVLAFDSTGRIRSLTTRGHSPRDGAIATLVRTLSDYRAAGPLSLPFRVDTTIDGSASLELSYTVESIEIDPAIDAAVITRPLEARP